MPIAYIFAPIIFVFALIKKISKNWKLIMVKQSKGGLRNGKNEKMVSVLLAFVMMVGFTVPKPI